ncbi:cytochrome C oxidase subunit IV [Gordoniibacillus kamchatkensis]|uniref:Cytochrome C oxidase subunit IV n=1 Tax=Gordoniibacillus kamchatkensis TaxID=1590651 RepID=A0ABR5AE35_9BACL|nr:cytochrome C oxidase subunit IV family protein [Paenibacillus sp. VKM B-2647]KIL39311.1 cytochrome C oxidase subunit IV [Paenibacillus sp. VKM B-2647]
MSEHTHEAVSDESKRHKHEGPRNHNLTYIVSALLTIFAFAAVLYGQLDRTFIILFIVVLGLIQAVFQLFFWMHAKEKGHFFPVIGIAFGFFIALTAVAAAVWWMWW